MRFMSSELVAPPPVFGMTHESGLIFRTSSSHSRQSVEEPLLPPEDVRAARRDPAGRRVRGSSWPVAARKFVRQCSQ